MKPPQKSDYVDYNSNPGKPPVSKSFQPLHWNETRMAEKLFQERHRQAKLSFNIAIGLTGAISILSIAVAVSVCNGNVPTATATAAMGLTTAGIASKWLFDLSDNANRRLDETAREFLDE